MADLREWCPDEAIEALTVRRALQNTEDPLQMAADLLKEALPLATMSMTHLAVYAEKPEIRFAASKFVVDKAFGDGRDLRLPDNKPAWDKIFDSVLVEVENITKKDVE